MKIFVYKRMRLIFVRMLPESWQSIIQLAVRFMAGHYYRASGSRGFLDHPSARGTFHSLINRVFQTIAYVHLTVWGVQISKYVKNYSLLRGFPRFRPDWIHWFHSFYSTTSEKNCLRAPEVKKKKKKSKSDDFYTAYHVFRHDTNDGVAKKIQFLWLKVYFGPLFHEGTSFWWLRPKTSI